MMKRWATAMRQNLLPRGCRLLVPAVLTIVLATLLSGCTGRGGGWLPPDIVLYSDQASFGFSFKCERSSKAYNPNPKPARLLIEVSYTEHGTFLGLEDIPASGPFSIHGVVDQIDPAIESMICIEDDPARAPGHLVFLGRYRVTSGDAPQFASCRTNTPVCRFEIEVQDNDGNIAPSAGDQFSITLAGPAPAGFELAEPFIYVRGGELAGGNLTVD